MPDLISRLQPLFRRTSTLSSSSRTKSSDSSTSETHAEASNWSNSLRLSKSRKASFAAPVYEEKESPPHLPLLATAQVKATGRVNREETPDTSPGTPGSPRLQISCPKLTLEEPTPQLDSPSSTGVEQLAAEDLEQLTNINAGISGQQPAVPTVKQSTVDGNDQSHTTVPLSVSKKSELHPTDPDYFGTVAMTNPPHRKVWVKRLGSSATQVIFGEEDLVDDVRDLILRKYANSLGHNFDSPDVSLKVVSRNHSARSLHAERALGPEESVSRVLDLYYPGGQTVEEALIIEVPQKRTPKHSPRVAMPYYLHDDFRPHESATDYFPQMPMVAQHSPHPPANLSGQNGQGPTHHALPHSMAVVTTGQLPNLPSPGSRMPRHSHRPKYGRQHTSSPTVTTSGPNPHTHGKPSCGASDADRS